LRPRRLGRRGGPAHGELVDDDLVGRAAGAAQHALAPEPALDGLLEVELARPRQPVGLAPGPRELRRLEQPGDEGQLDLTDGGRAGLEVGVQGLALAHEAVRLPPPALARLAGDRHDLRPPLVVDAERVQDLHHVVLVDDVAVLQAGDLGPALADHLRQLHVGDPGLGAQGPQLGSQSQATDVWTDHARRTDPVPPARTLAAPGHRPLLDATCRPYRDQPATSISVVPATTRDGRPGTPRAGRLSRLLSVVDRAGAGSATRRWRRPPR